MTTRRAFIVAGAAAAGLLTGFPQATIPAAAAPKATPTPAPTPTPPAPPSRLARELAQSLRRDLPKAHLGDALTEKIASDIQGNLAIGSSLRKRHSDALPPPDFVFTASEADRP